MPAAEEGKKACACGGRGAGQTGAWCRASWLPAAAPALGSGATVWRAREGTAALGLGCCSIIVCP